MNEAADEALRRARSHLQTATLEGLQAARALLDVAVHGSGLTDAAEDGLVAELRRSLDELIAAIRRNAPFSLPTQLTEPLSSALDAEIERWERRSRTDPDARPVLRAFLGLRELLWEIGVGRDPASPTDSGRSDGAGTTSPKAEQSRPDARPRARRTASARDRVQRFRIDD